MYSPDLFSPDLFSPDCLFPTDNKLEIPTLRLDMQAEYCEIPFVCFGETKRTYKMKGTGTLHFYTDDYRFNSLYDHPEKILAMNPSCMVEPNYSVFTDTPIAFGLQSIYRKRWIARMMQEHGIRVFVDLNVAPKYYQVNLFGVPKGYRSFCTRGSEDRMSQLDNEYHLACMRAGSKDILFVVYGGGDLCRKWCSEHSAVYVNPLINYKNSIKQHKELFKQGILFFDGELPIEEDKKQVYNYSTRKYEQ